MNKTTFLLSFFLLIAFPLLADNHQHPINLEHKGGPRSGNLPTCPDAPQAYYCYNDKSQWILFWWLSFVATPTGTMPLTLLTLIRSPTGCIPGWMALTLTRSRQPTWTATGISRFTTSYC